MANDPSGVSVHNVSFSREAKLFSERFPWQRQIKEPIRVADVALSESHVIKEKEGRKESRNTLGKRRKGFFSLTTL